VNSEFTASLQPADSGTLFAISKRMKNIGFALILTLISSAAIAQERPVAPAVLSVQSANPDSNRVNVALGAVQLTTHNTRYHLVYLPLLPPLQGTAFRTTREIPNGLALTATQFPATRREQATVTIR
jgi:hypothetical protein